MLAKETNDFLIKENFLQEQNEIHNNHRKKLVLWLVDVQKKFDLKPETLFIGVNILDRYT